MRALIFDGFGEMPYIANLPIPTAASSDQVVIKVEATGLCRSDWHSWMGHDTDITVFPHTPGHEFAGTIHAIGSAVSNFKIGDRVTTPFVCGCGKCHECLTGNAQICRDQWQPGFAGPGSFAEYVQIPNADFNLVAIPENMSFDIAASLGCRFATSYRALALIHPPKTGESVAIFGCGGVGLAAIMIAKSRGANVIAVDISKEALDVALTMGADVIINSHDKDPVDEIRNLTDSGVDITVDALGSIPTADAAIRSLRRGGHHLQIGLLLPPAIKERATIPMHVLISRELHVHGVHGMAAADYSKMINEIESGFLHPERLMAGKISLESAPKALVVMDGVRSAGITIINP